MQRLSTCLMFAGDQHGRAEEAMEFHGWLADRFGVSWQLNLVA